MPNSHADMERTLMAGSTRPPSPISPIAAKATDTHTPANPTTITDPSTSTPEQQQQPMPATAMVDDPASISGALAAAEIQSHLIIRIAIYTHIDLLHRRHCRD